MGSVLLKVMLIKCYVPGCNEFIVLIFDNVQIIILFNRQEFVNYTQIFERLKQMHLL